MDLNLFMYYILSCIHVLIWLFVVFAFINKETAKINITYLIPIIYIWQIFPVHLINKTKCDLNKNCEEDNTNIIKGIGFYYLKEFFNFSFENPLSAQGLMILGAILSYYKIQGII